MTDMHIMDVDLPAGVRGSTSCTWSVSVSCDRWDVKVDEAQIWDDSVATGEPFRKNHGKTFCHEIGHSLGLDHYTKNQPPAEFGGVEDCMANGVVTAADIWQQYNWHHIGSHINNEF